MVRVYIDLPVFSSATENFGLATGELDIDSLPDTHDEFPWPKSWPLAKPAYFSKHQSAILGIGPWGTSQDAKVHISLCGIVCENLQDAKECSMFLESVGLQFHDLQVEA